MAIVTAWARTDVLEIEAEHHVGLLAFVVMFILVGKCDCGGAVIVTIVLVARTIVSDGTAGEGGVVGQISR